MSSISKVINEMTEAGFSTEVAVSGDYHVVNPIAMRAL